jgi:hypothetical protein
MKQAASVVRCTFPIATFARPFGPLPCAKHNGIVWFHIHGAPIFEAKLQHTLVATNGRNDHLAWQKLACVSYGFLGLNSSTQHRLLRHWLPNTDASATLKHPVERSGELLVLQEEVTYLCLSDHLGWCWYARSHHFVDSLTAMKHNVPTVSPNHTLIPRVERL